MGEGVLIILLLKQLLAPRILHTRDVGRVWPLLTGQAILVDCQPPLSARFHGFRLHLVERSAADETDPAGDGQSHQEQERRHHESNRAPTSGQTQQHGE